jgi:Ca2+-binding EF-hand superfamily protein
LTTLIRRVTSFYFTSFTLLQDGDGKITRLEIGNAIRCAGGDPTEAEIQAIISGGDANGDGLIDFDEFVEMSAERLAEDNSEQLLEDAFKVLSPAEFTL